MKMAILLCGHMRTYDKTIESWKKYIPNFDDIDIFIHTWDTIDRLTSGFYKTSNKTYAVDIKDITNIYKQKDIIIEKQNLDSTEFIWPNSTESIKGSFLYFESWYKANQLKQNYEKKHNFTYDLVIKLRPDIFLKEPLLLNNINTNFVYVFGRLNNDFSTKYNYQLTGKDFKLLNKQCSIIQYSAADTVLISNSNNMDYIANIGTKIWWDYEKINQENIKKGKKYKNRAWGLKATHLIDYLIDGNLNIKLTEFYYPIQWDKLLLQ